MTSSGPEGSGSPVKPSFVLKRELRMAPRKVTATNGGPSTSPASPVVSQSTSSQKRPPAHRGPRGRARASEQSDVLTLKAQGLSNERIEKALNMGHHQVAAIVRDPMNQAEIASRRLWLKSRTTQRLEALLEPAWNMAQEAAETKDAKMFDAAMRGLHAGEKISASVAGENQRVQVEHSGEVKTDREPITVQIQQLIAMVKGHDRPGPDQLNP